jgi:SPP1 family predicted phage head-tail adaptor
MKAGELRERFQFAFRVETDDGLGNKQGAWVEQFTVWAKKITLRGGESIMASRLSGRCPAIVTIRYSIQASQITTDWRCTDTRTTEVFNIRQVTVSPKRNFIDLLLEAGVAV